MTKELLIYIDPGFLDNVGHYRNFADNIHKEARKRGVDIWHFVNEGVSDDIVRKYGLEKIFAYKAILRENYPSEKKSFNLLKVAGKICRGLVERLRAVTAFFFLKKKHDYKGVLNTTDGYNAKALLSFSEKLETVLDRVLTRDYSKVSIYMYTAHPLYFPVFAGLLNRAKYSGLNIAAHIGLFYLNLEFCLDRPVPDYESVLRLTAKLLERDDPGRKITLCADSQRVVDKYSPYFKRPLKVFPIPLSLNYERHRVPESPRKNGPGLVVGFFGYAHVKQGYHLVGRLYRELVEAEGYSHIHFVVRHNINLVMAELRQSIKEFRAESKRITHLVGDLPKEEYEAKVASCDIVLIPHSRDAYPCQTSGLFVDCLKKGKVVVVPEDTWLADEIRCYGAGETFASGDLAGFVEAVKKVCDNFPEYHSRTGRRIEEFAGFHTAEALFDIMGVGSPSAGPVTQH